MKKIHFVALLILTLTSWQSGEIKLEKKTLLNGKVEILLPKDFNLMPENMLKLKYPTAPVRDTRIGKVKYWLVSHDPRRYFINQLREFVLPPAGQQALLS